MALVEGPPHMTSPDGQLEVWLIEPSGMVDVHRGGHFAAEQAAFIIAEASAAVEKLAAARGTRATFVHDWSRVRSYDLRTRTSLIEWGLKWGRDRVDNIWIVLAADTPTLVRMAVQLGVMAMK